MIDEEKQEVNEQTGAGEQADDGHDLAGEEYAYAESADIELSLEERLAAAEALAEEYLDGWQRSRAEFANARKRMQRESAETFRNATVEMITRLLPVIDDFDRAMQSVPESIRQDSWFQGLVLVHRKLQGILDGAAIEPIPAVGLAFDPNVHNAIMKEASDEHESGQVVRELQTGYRLGDRVIRPTLVVVAE